jgi:uncharacterized membrane protein
MTKKRKQNPNRFQKTTDQKFFTFDKIRINLFLWGMVAGAIGGFFALKSGFAWQVAGIFAMVFISNYHINKAAQQIPRWHAALYSFFGLMLALLTVAILGALAISRYGLGEILQ